MEAARIGDESDCRPREVTNHSSKILPVVAIYGANGSGKSNVLSAFAYMKEAVSLSQRFWGARRGGAP
jgi:AAA15 family ATPase/GTPase